MNNGIGCNLNQHLRLHLEIDPSCFVNRILKFNSLTILGLIN